MKEQILNDIAEKVMVNLAKHNIELSVKDESNKLITEYYGLSDTINSRYSSISKEIRALYSKIDEVIKISQKMPSVISKYENLAKELGIDVNNIQELKSLKLAVKDVEQYKKLQNGLKSFIS
jgi:hypothetical protein